MISRDMGSVLVKFTGLGRCLNAVIDSGAHAGISKDDIYTHLKDKTIFQYLADNFEIVANWGLSNFSEEEKWLLLGEWQSMANAIDSQSELGVSNNGISLLLGYVLEGIQMRTFDSELWPCPEPS